MYAIELSEEAEVDLVALRAVDRSRIIKQIERQLPYEPNRESRNRKPLRGLVPPWQHLEPTWELRIGEYRVFYDVDEILKVVAVRAVRHKPPHSTTDEIL